MLPKNMFAAVAPDAPVHPVISASNETALLNVLLKEVTDSTFQLAMF